MTLTTFLAALVGGFLVWLGMVGGAIAARIRDGKLLRAVAHQRTKRAEPSPKIARERVEIATIPMLSDVRDALIGLGFKSAAASQAAAEARRQLGDGAPLDAQIRKALQLVANPARA